MLKRLAVVSPLRAAVLAAALTGVVVLPFAPLPGLTSAAQAQEATRTQRVQFEPGTSARTVRGRVRGYETLDYVLGARSGQTLTVEMTSANRSAYFNVTRRGEDQALFVGSGEGARFSGVLPSDGDYVVRVYLMRNAARRSETASYVLNIGAR